MAIEDIAEKGLPDAKLGAIDEHRRGKLPFEIGGESKSFVQFGADKDPAIAFVKRTEDAVRLPRSAPRPANRARPSGTKKLAVAGRIAANDVGEVRCALAQFGKAGGPRQFEQRGDRLCPLAGIDQQRSAVPRGERARQCKRKALSFFSIGGEEETARQIMLSPRTARRIQPVDGARDPGVSPPRRRLRVIQPGAQDPQFHSGLEDVRRQSGCQAPYACKKGAA